MWLFITNCNIILVFTFVTLIQPFASHIETKCPLICECLEQYVDCHKKSLIHIPEFPEWSEEIDLSSNRLHDVTVVDMSYLHNLKELKLNNCSLNMPQFLLPKAFEVIYLNKNHIFSISNENFPKNNSLKVLHLNNNKIRHINKDSFINLQSLNDLKLNKNELQHLDKTAFHSLVNLKTLELNKNNLHNISTLVFSQLEKLEELKLKNNHIENIMDGAFVGLKSLTILNVDFNKLTSVSKGWMYGLESLLILTLSHNSITRIEHDCWEISTNLKELDLSHNDIVSIDINTLEHLTNLKMLNLKSNKIVSIAHAAFSQAPALLELNLNSNEISWTIEDMSGPFSSLEQLQKLNLAGNAITSINPKAFEGLKSLTEIDLRNNNITAIHEHSFQSMNNLKKIYLNSKSMLCVCNLQWIISWMQTVDSSGMTALCSYPLQLKGQSILKIKNEYCGDSPRPRVVEHPTSHLAIKGKSSELRCVAQSKPFTPMNFVWKKNNVNITAKVNNSIIENEDGIRQAVSVLTIANISQADTGKYQCIVTNDFGGTYSNKAKINIVTFPKFTMVPINATVNMSETVSLKCAATGDPTPEISWKKDGGNDFPAAQERRMHVMPADHLFFIVNAKTSDNGVYSCAAKNPAGLIVANATLTVLEEPTFVTVTENKEVVTGESAVLKCMISGSPKPHIQWFKDGNLILQSERRYSFSDSDQLLIIFAATESDAGYYDCQIENELGAKNSTTLLKVLPAVTALVNEDDMRGIIIITVVSCAVGTSIVWVVIICQTRRRLTNNTNTYMTENITMSPFIYEREMCSPGISDNVSEKSSCKDSGTGDSTRQSFDLVSSSPEHFTSLENRTCHTYAPPGSCKTKYLQSSFKPNMTICIENTNS